MDAHNPHVAARSRPTRFWIAALAALVASFWLYTLLRAGALVQAFKGDARAPPFLARFALTVYLSSMSTAAIIGCVSILGTLVVVVRRSGSRSAWWLRGAAVVALLVLAPYVAITEAYLWVESRFAGVPPHNAPSGVDRDLLTVAREGKDPAKLRDLLSRGASVAAVWSEPDGPEDAKYEPLGRTALHFAVKSANAEMVKMLIEARSDVNALDDGHHTPLHLAAALPLADTELTTTIARLLLDHGADPLRFERCEREIDVSYACVRTSAIGTAIEWGHLAIAGLLVERVKDRARAIASLPMCEIVPARRLVELLRDETLVGVGSLKASDGHGNTLLHDAASREVAEFLMGAGLSPDARNARGQTPLHVAATRGYVNLFLFLAERGADMSARDAAGKTPTDLATDTLRTVLEMGPAAGREWVRNNYRGC